MRKITFLLGAGVGFFAGSKAGPAAYQQLEAKIRKTANRPGGGQTAEYPKNSMDEASADPKDTPLIKPSSADGAIGTSF